MTSGESLDDEIAESRPVVPPATGHPCDPTVATDTSGPPVDIAKERGGGGCARVDASSIAPLAPVPAPVIASGGNGSNELGGG